MHKDYTTTPESFIGQLPTVSANEISDLYAQGESPASVQGMVRINGQKLSRSLVNTVYGHIKIIEDTCVRILNGTSMVYSPPEIMDSSIGEFGEEISIPTGTYPWEVPNIPIIKAELMGVLMQIIALEGDNFSNVYDATFTELISQIEHIVDNVIKAQNKGTGMWNDFYNAVK